MAINTVTTHVMTGTYPCNVLKAFSKMRLHGSGIFGLRENLQEFVIGEKVEAGKSHSLSLQVLAESFLYLIE